LNVANNIDNNFFLDGVQHNVKSKGQGKSHLKVVVSYPFSKEESYDIVKPKGGIAMFNVKKICAALLFILGVYALIDFIKVKLFSSIGGPTIAITCFFFAYLMWTDGEEREPTNESGC
jgi:hypothetical protein